MDIEEIKKLESEYGLPLYIFDEVGFRENYLNLLNTFRSIYPKYNIAYSYKTNYTPSICKIVKELGGYAEVVSEMEYQLAKKIGYENEKIIFNGPVKGEAGFEAFKNGSIVNIDNKLELENMISIAKQYPQKKFSLGIRVNLDIGQDFVSRFGIEHRELETIYMSVDKVENLNIVGLHCHISRCRSIEAWKKRVEVMLSLSDIYFTEPPLYIDLGSGMYGDMDEYLARQFDNVPSYLEYGNVVARIFADHYKCSVNKPLLFTEPGTTLINKYIKLVSKIEAIKKIRGKCFAVLNCSIHNLGETCLLKNLPMNIIHNNINSTKFDSLDFSGYTCLEQDIMFKNFKGQLSVGDYVVFGNVGGYSNVLKPPFIRPNCAMVSKVGNNYKIIKKAETFDYIFETYVF